MRSNLEIITSLYDKYYQGDKARHWYFDLLARNYKPKNVLYPGGFIHINASYVFPKVTYVDDNKNAIRFFKVIDDVIKLIDLKKSIKILPHLNFMEKTIILKSMKTQKAMIS